MNLTETNLDQHRTPEVRLRCTQLPFFDEAIFSTPASVAAMKSPAFYSLETRDAHAFDQIKGDVF